jgi:membrane fusion protein (multidrug efflux system)
MQQDATERPRRIGGLDKKVPSSQQAEPNWRPPRLAAPRRWLRRFLLLLGPLVVAIVGGYFYVTGGRYVSTENAYVQADKVMCYSVSTTGPII